jgi:hypothetical protein
VDPYAGLSRRERQIMSILHRRGRATAAEVRAELREARAALSNFKRFLNTTAYLPTGPQARVLPDGMAQAPDNAPEVVKRVILAANQIAKFPYKWGGGHGAWKELAATDEANRRLWEELGFTVHELASFHAFAQRAGALHCIAKELER